MRQPFRQEPIAERARVALHARLARCDARIAAHAKNSLVAQRAGEVLGIGPVTSSALAATVPDAKNGRQFGAWLGLTPQQHSSGGKTRLGMPRHGNDTP